MKQLQLKEVVKEAEGQDQQCVNLELQLEAKVLDVEILLLQKEVVVQEAAFLQEVELELEEDIDGKHQM